MYMYVQYTYNSCPMIFKCTEYTCTISGNTINKERETNAEDATQTLVRSLQMCGVYPSLQHGGINRENNVGDAAAGLGLHFLHMSEGPFSHDAGHMVPALTLLDKQCTCKYILTPHSNSTAY